MKTTKVNNKIEDTNYDLKLGSYISFVAPNYFLNSVELALSFNENCFMMYTGAPQNTKRVPFSKYNFLEGKQVWNEAGYKMSDVIVHCPYIVNPASPDKTKQAFAISFIAQDIKRVHEMGIKYYILHPGKYMDSDLQTGIATCADSINEIHDLTKDTDVTICLETMAGVGTEIASTFLNMGEIIRRVKNQSRIGVCIDTCHIWDAGYDLTDPENVFKQFDDAIGLKYLKCLHINDSKNARGSHKDRHANIGYGKIGFETLLKWVYNKNTNGMVKVLETPKVGEKTPYKEEIEMLRTKKFRDWINDENR